MGYSTDFSGELKFTEDLTRTQMAYLKSMLGEDCREHPEWETKDLYYIDLEFLDDFSGLKWDGSEKTYGMVEIVNLITRQMRKIMPSFRFAGGFDAQGEDAKDTWQLVFDESGKAMRRDVPKVGDTIKCPHCGEDFEIN